MLNLACQVADILNRCWLALLADGRSRNMSVYTFSGYFPNESKVQARQDMAAWGLDECAMHWANQIVLRENQLQQQMK